MPNSDIATMLRAVIQEELQPVRQELQGLKEDVQELKKGQAALKKGQQQMQKDISNIKYQLKGVWEDILRLDNRIADQEKKTDRRL